VTTYKLRTGPTTSVTVPCPPPLIGGQKTSIAPNMDSKVGIDWVGLTFHPRTRDDDLRDSLEAGAWRDPGTMFSQNFHWGLIDKIKLAASAAMGCSADEWVGMPNGFRGYNKQLMGPAGARILFDPGDGLGHIHLLLPGKACSMISQSGMRSLMAFGVTYEANATRLDLTMDDYRYIITPEELDDVISGPDVVTHCQRAGLYKNRDIHTKATTGATVYIGQRSSRQMLRVYDKGLESSGVIPAIRWELESKKEAAQSLMELLAASDPRKYPTELGELFASRLMSFVDFRAASSYAKIEDRKQLAWFTKLIGEAKKATAYITEIAKTVKPVIAWFSKSVAPSLNMLKEYWGKDYNHFLENQRNVR